MMGQQAVAQERFFYSFILDTHIPPDHLLRRIDRFLDLSELRQRLAAFYSHTGRPSIDPELMIRMLIVGYCFGIRSERRLCEEVHLNLAVLEKNVPRTEVWRALYGAVAWNRAAGKYVIAVNDDIDPDDANALLWAMSYRANPSLDIQILPHRDQGHGPRSKRNGGEDAAVLIDATMKEPFPPISLPKREYMERARAIWEELGLPKLKPEAPWYGYSLGEWPADLDRAAEMAVKGDYFETGKALEKLKRRDVGMNTEVRDLGRKQDSDE
jgi:hypothetical protein